jgi:hypothetical protein
MLTPPYDAYVSSGAARATQMLAILRRAAGQEDQPITAEPGLRSFVEDRWRDVARPGKSALSHRRHWRRRRVPSSRRAVPGTCAVQASAST